MGSTRGARDRRLGLRRHNDVRETQNNGLGRAPRDLSRRTLLGFGGASLLALTTACGTESKSSGGDETVRLGAANAPDQLGTKDVTRAIIDAAKNYKGHDRLKIDPYFNGALGGESAMLANTVAAGLDMVLMTSAVMASVAPDFNITELPSFWTSKAAHAESLAFGPAGKHLLASLEAKGLKGLAIPIFGSRAVLSKEPIESIDDVQNLTIRVSENGLYVRTWRAVGASPVTITFPEVYTALQTGTVDAADGTLSGFVQNRSYEVARHLAFTEQVYSAGVLAMSLHKWQKLPADLQRVIESAAAAGLKENVPSVEDYTQKQLDILVSEGVEVTRPDTAPFRARTRNIWRQYSDKIGPKFLADTKRQQEAI
jgi:TRAP-type transport system periplasmic protein